MKRASLSLLFLSLCLAKSAFAAPLYAISADGASVVVFSDTGSPLSANTFDTSPNSPFGASFGSWNVATNPNNPADKVAVEFLTSAYKTDTKNTLTTVDDTQAGGGEFRALYSTTDALPSSTSRPDWVQIVTTNYPAHLSAPLNSTTRYLDNSGSTASPLYPGTLGTRAYAVDPNHPAHLRDGTTPLYPNLAAQDSVFWDFSRRDSTAFATGRTNPVTWNAQLYPVLWDSAAPTSLEVGDGMTWGWEMKKAMAGTDSGVFVNALPGTAAVSGLGTSTFLWGEDDPDVPGIDRNSLTFVGGVFDTTPGAVFKLGTLTYHNATTLLGTGATSVDFDLGLTFENIPVGAPERTPTPYRSNFKITNTPNTGDPIGDADNISLAGFALPLHSIFSVEEGATASVEIFGTLSTGVFLAAGGERVDNDVWAPYTPDANPVYSLSIVGFANPTDGGFLVSEPSTLRMIALCLVVLCGFRICRKTLQIRVTPEAQGV